MNKKLIDAAGVAALIIATYAAVSWYAGSRIEADNRVAVEALNAHLAKTWSDQVRITPVTYNRSIFSSEASYVLTLPAAADNGGVKHEILILNHIQHGPLPLAEIKLGHFSPHLASIRTVKAPTPFTEPLFKLTQGRSPLDGDTRVDFDGAAVVTWSLLPVDYTVGDTHTVFSGARLNADIGRSFKSSRGELKVEGLSVTRGGSSIEIKGARLHTDTHFGTFGLNVGTSGATAESLNVTLAGKPAVAVTRIETRVALTENGPLLNGEMHYDIGSLSVDQKNWGTLSLTALYDKLGGDATKSLIDLNNNLLARSVNNAPDADLVTSADVKQFWQYLHTLLQHNPTFRIAPFSWKSPEGESQFSLSATFAAADLHPGGIGLASNPVQTLDATLTLSRPMIAGLVTDATQATGVNPGQAKLRAEKDLKTWLQTADRLKLGKMEGNNFVSKLTYEKQVFKLNGQAAPMNAFWSFLGTVVPPGWINDDIAASQDGPDGTASIRHLDPSVIAAILTSAEFTFEETRDDQGDPLLKVAPGNSGAAKIEINFVGCGTDPTCEDVLLRATFSPDKPVALKVVNDWNLRNRWARAYVNQKHEATIEMDINAYGGIGRDALEAMVNTFFKIVGDFSKELDTPAQ